ncbi:FKBP-type peptidyl-prolyl cis-trans isomerase [Fragilaria crotonensis]|nr:FKBP-type peptidyl-prolyl cis-trans isomerase [Fragilaria crotonensis]
MSSDSSNKDLEYGDYLGVSTCHHIPNVEEKYLLYTPGSVLAIQVPSNDSSSWTRVRISAGAKLTLSVATASFDREVPHSDDLDSDADNNKKEKTAELRYSCEGTDCNDITIVRFVPGQPTITGLGLVWEGSQIITFTAVSPWGSVTVCGNVGHQTPQPQQPHDVPHEHVTTQKLLPQVSNDNNSIAKTPATTSKIRKRKPDAQALIDELAEMQREELPIKEQVPPNSSKRTKVDDKSSTTVSTKTLDSVEGRQNLNGSQETITTQQVAADRSSDSSQQQEEQQQQGDKPQVLSRKERKKLAKEKAKELEQALALTRQPTASTTTTALTTNGGSVTSKSTLPTSLIKERRLKSGIVVKDICLGTGPLIQPGRKVSIHYTGTFQDGTVFDASAINKPLQFRHGTGQVVRGLDEGMVGMRVAGERVLVIPPHLGYGEKGSGNRIPPNATIVFTVSLLSVGG